MANSNRMVKGERKGGRKKGTRYKVTSVLKGAILLAGEQAGNGVGNQGLVSYLQHQALANPVAFMGLLAKVLPLQVNAAADMPLVHAKIELVAKSPGTVEDADVSMMDGEPKHR